MVKLAVFTSCPLPSASRESKLGFVRILEAAVCLLP